MASLRQSRGHFCIEFFSVNRMAFVYMCVTGAYTLSAVIVIYSIFDI